jgi:hypothetical protein
VWNNNWKPAASDDTLQAMVYENGDPCQPNSEKRRSATVIMKCSQEKLELTYVHESVECEYSLLMYTPFPCPVSDDNNKSNDPVCGSTVR